MRRNLCNDVNYFIFDRYDVRWYVAPIEMQKIILFIMQKTTKPYCLNIGNILPATIENFKKVENVYDIKKSKILNNDNCFKISHCSYSRYWYLILR